VNWIKMAQNRTQWPICLKMALNLQAKEVLNQLNKHERLKGDSEPCSSLHNC